MKVGVNPFMVLKTSKARVLNLLIFIDGFPLIFHSV